jgi:TRAP-type C4-dicarboxylate transport system permease small subunit
VPQTERAALPERRIVRVIEALSLLCGAIAASLIFASVLITCQMIFVRFVLNASTIWQTEAVVYMMIGATVLGLPYVQKLKGHVNVDLLPMLLPPRWRNGLAVLVLGLSIAVAGLMTWFGYELFHIAFERNWKSDTVWGVPLWIPYSVLPLGFGLYIAQLAVDMLRLRRGATLLVQGDHEEDH